MEQLDQAYLGTILTIGMICGVNNLVAKLKLELPLEQEEDMHSLGVGIMMNLHGNGAIGTMVVGTMDDYIISELKVTS